MQTQSCGCSAARGTRTNYTITDSTVGLLQATLWDDASLSLTSAPSLKFHRAYSNTVFSEKESTMKPSRTKKQPWLNREMNKSLTENSGESKERLFSNYTFILNGEVLGWEPAGELPQSAEWKTASVTCFQIRHHKADSSPRPWETTLTKIHTGDLLRKACMGKAFGRQERIRSFQEKCLRVL